MQRSAFISQLQLTVFFPLKRLSPTACTTAHTVSRSGILGIASYRGDQQRSDAIIKTVGDWSPTGMYTDLQMFD